MKIAIIGGGPGGYVAAIKAAMLGAEVTIIEKQNVGGTCLNRGCIPTKALLASSEVYEMAKKAMNFGVNINGDIMPDITVMNRRKDTIVNQLVNGIKYLLSKKGVKLISGVGRFIDQNRIEVLRSDSSVELIEADKVILATGSVPVIPSMFKYEGKRVITSDEALNLKELPKSMTIIGGGVIGCEFGQFFSKLGTEVTIVEMANHILPGEDIDIANVLNYTLENQNITIAQNNKVEEVEIKENGVAVTLINGEIIQSDILLVSVGRKANIEELRLENIGVEIKSGKVVVNDKLETNIKNIYAIGDLIDSPFLAHVASKEGIVAAENALGKFKKMDYKAVPRCVYTSPEVASVGITEVVAKQNNIEYKIGRYDFSGLGKAQVIDKSNGFIKILAGMDDKIIGASIIGPHATDLLAGLTMAVHFGLTAEELGDVIYPHPTLSEGLMEALHDVNNQCIHSI